MAATASPYGLKAVNHLGGTPYAGSTRLYPIASGYAVNIYNGSVVKIVNPGNATDGTIEIVNDLGNNADAFVAGTIGVFVGCTFTDPNSGNVTFRQNYPTGTVAADIQAYVIDDPQVIFMAQASATVAATELGRNIPFTALQATGTGNLISGNSTSSVNAAGINATATIAFRIVDFVDSPTSTVGDAFTDLLIKFNPTYHQMTASLGI
tara:strand:- start:42 stop:665 length:624 start_codon:yes stop_codon:yes gene_type:complete